MKEQERKILTVTSLGKFGVELARATVSKEIDEVRVYIVRSKLEALLQDQGITVPLEILDKPIITKNDIPELLDPHFSNLPNIQNILWQTANNVQLTLFTNPELFGNAQVILVGHNVSGIEAEEEREEYKAKGEKTILRDLARYFSVDAEVISLAKGITSDGLRPSEKMREFMENPISVIAGPSLGETMVKAVFRKTAQTRLNLAGSNESRLRIQKYFDPKKIRFRETKDVKATELLGAWKNVYALIFGILRGYASDEETFLTHEAIANITPRVHQENKTLLEKLGVKRELFVDSPAGLPDLELTIQHGRNGKCGFEIGKLFASWKNGNCPETPEERIAAIQNIVKSFGDTVEGYKSLSAICEYLAERGISEQEMLLIKYTREVILEGKKFDIVARTIERLLNFNEKEIQKDEE